MTRTTPLVFVLLAANAASIAQPIIPPEPHNEPSPMAVGYWSNLGQLMDQEGGSTMEPGFVSEGTYPFCYPGRRSMVSFVAAAFSTDSLLPDTLYRWDMRLGGEGVVPIDPVGVDPRADHRNFYFPHCPVGVTNVQRHGRVVYEGVYPGIDLHLYVVPGGQRMAFVCHPGSDPALIRMDFEGAMPEVDDAGGLVFNALQQYIRFPKPFVYQFIGEEVVSAEQEGVGYLVDGPQVRFSLGTYNADLPVVLLIGEAGSQEVMLGGPDLEGICWSTYFGGERADWIRASTLDEASNYFVTGTTSSSFPLFPPTGIAAINPSNTQNAFTAKFNAQDHLAWSTIIGGGGSTSTTATTVAVARSATNKNVYVGGFTNSPSLPTLASGVAYYDVTGVSANQGFLMRFNNSDGLRTWTTYFGESGSRVFDIDFLGSSQLIVTGDASTTLPVPQVPAPTGATTYPYGGGQDALVALFNTNDQLRWITHYGGSGTEGGRGIVSFGKSFYVLGQTQNGAIPLVNKAGAYNDASANGYADLFILLFNANAVNQWASYFGGSLSEEISFSQNMAVNPSYGDLYIVGGTSSSAASFPLLNGGPGSYNSSGSGLGTHGFIARFNGSTQALKWCTLFGGGSLGRMAVTVSPSGDVFTSGMLQGANMPVTPPQPFAYDQPLINWNSATGGPVEQDCYVARFRASNVLDWCTYFGGNAGSGFEEMNTLVCKDYHWLYAAGTTSKRLDPSSFFPIVPHSDPLAYFDPTWNQQPLPEGYDAYVTKFCPSALPIVGPEEKSTIQALVIESRLLQLGSGRYRFVGPGAAGQLLVHNTMGQVVRSFFLPWAVDGSEPFGLDGLAPGVYLVGQEGQARTKLFLEP